MDFNIDNNVTANKPQLEGFKIHDVEFKGCEKADYKNGEYKVIVIKFENEYGFFRETIFEPKADDAKRTKSQYGDNPSRVEHITELFKMLVQAVNPELAKKIADGQTLSIKSWENMRDFFVKATEKFIGTKTQIKLDKNGKGESSFPGFFLALNKEGSLYRKSTFIGDKLGFTAKELERHAKFVASKPTTMKKTPTINLDLGDDATDTVASSKELSLEDLNNL